MPGGPTGPDDDGRDRMTSLPRALNPLRHAHYRLLAASREAEIAVQEQTAS